MHHYKAFGLQILSDIPLPELSAGDAGTSIDLEIKTGNIDHPALKKTKIFRRGIQADFGENSNQDLFLNWKGIASYQAINGNLLVVSPATQDENLISLFTVSEALGLILFQRGNFLLHASAVLVGNEAWCFMGAPGAGKSTTAAAFIKAGCRLLSDDLTAIDFNENGEPVILPAYPQIKIWNNTVNGLDYDKMELQPVSEGVNKFSYQPRSTFSHEKVRLGKVFFLHKARNRKPLLLLNAVEIPTETLKNFPLPLPLLKGDALKRHFMQSFQCASSAEMWRKRRPEGFGNLEKWIEESIELTKLQVNG